MMIIPLMALQAMMPNSIADKSGIARPGTSIEVYVRTACELVDHQISRKINSCFEIEQMNLFDKWMDQFRKYWENPFNSLEKILSTTKNQPK